MYLHDLSIYFTNQLYLSTLYLKSFCNLALSNKVKVYEAPDMKKLVSAITLIMTGLIATSAIAGPHEQDRRDRHVKPAPTPAHWNHSQPQRFDHNRNDDKRYEQNRHKNQVNPSLQWRVGQTLPRQYNSSSFELSDRQAKNLPKASRNQQWYKINGDYVLVNERNDRIVRIIG
jgi:Ni/Co efflux regulator RcnB